MVKRIHALTAVAILAALCTACRSSPDSSYYLLTANSAAGSGRADLSLGVGPVTIPEFLQRSQIAYAMTGNTLEVSRWNLWSEPLDLGIARVLSINLARLNPSSTVVLFPWRIDATPRYGIRISVMELNRSGSNRATLDVEWSLIDLQTRAQLSNTHFNQSADFAAFSYAALAAAYSDLLARLSEDISAGLAIVE